HGFEVGDQISGTASINLTIYNDCAEVTGLSAATEGISVTKGVTVNPIATTIDQLDKSMQGCLIYLANVTYEGGVFKDATGQITPYNIFTTLPTLTEGGAYNATGVAVWFKKEGIWEIAPRTADEFAEASVAVAKPLIVPSGGVFAEPQQVTITAQEGCTIMYTTDGTEPSATVGSRYTAPFTVSEECTVKAVAINKENKVSAVATAEFRFIADEAIQSIAALCAAAPAEGTADVLVSIKNWIVTGVKGNQLFFTDGKNGIVNYCKGHGFEVGDIVNGEVIVTLTVFNECAEITSLTAATEGITVTKGEGATPMTVAIADLQKDMQGCLLYFEGLTYSAEEGAFIDDDDNKIVPNNKFVSLPELIDGQTYNVTGVAVWFVQSGGSSYWAIAPRTADEFVLVTSQIAPISSWSVESETVDVNGKATATFTTNSDGQVTYESSDETVATIDAEGNITPVGRGVATITANVAETETYLPDSKSFTLTVTEAGYEDATFAYNDEDIQGQGAPDTGSELTATRGVLTLYANKAYAKVGETHIKFYGSKFEGKDEDKVLTEPSFIQLSVPEGYVITDIVLTATGESYSREWKDQNGNATVNETNIATWKGELSEVILTNQAGGQARIKTIAVTFKNTGSAGMEGDLNGDEKVDIADAVAVLEVMARDGNDPEADLNGDGKVDIADFVAVLEIMAKQ
ncbi:MAG: chitobiase/beta-hexosaminidase C-terminal domain-containing protein, partial [Bacteroidaceae bacterium]|nr:chitobiase/beta-hexosaminidase C-terminal domain-containing protein [Bacteroidaceae bacterium]